MPYTWDQSQPLVYVEKVTTLTQNGTDDVTTEVDHYEEPTTSQVFGYNANGFIGLSAEKTGGNESYNTVVLTHLADEMPMRWTLEVTITDLTDFSTTTREDIVELLTNTTTYTLQCSADDQSLQVTAESFESPV